MTPRDFRWSMSTVTGERDGRPTSLLALRPMVPARREDAWLGLRETLLTAAGAVVVALTGYVALVLLLTVAS